jgi:hypothetical protein
MLPAAFFCSGVRSPGAPTFSAGASACSVHGANQPEMDALAEATRIEEPYHTEYLGIPVFGVAHPGGNGTPGKRWSASDYAKMAGTRHILPFDPGMMASQLVRNKSYTRAAHRPFGRGWRAGEQRQASTASSASARKR